MPGKLVGWNPSLRPFDPTIPLCDRRHGVGSALVMRKDGKPLCRTHIAAFVDYARNKLVSYCHDNRDTVRGVLESCSKEDGVVCRLEDGGDEWTWMCRTRMRSSLRMLSWRTRLVLPVWTRPCTVRGVTELKKGVP